MAMDKMIQDTVNLITTNVWVAGAVGTIVGITVAQFIDFNPLWKLIPVPFPVEVPEQPLYVQIAGSDRINVARW